MIRFFLSRVTANQFVKTKNLKAMNLLSYGLEILAAFYSTGKRKVK